MNQVSGLRAAGDLDLLFGEGGLATMPDRTKAIAALPDNKLILATGFEIGHSHKIVRLTERGAPDESFGPGGEVVIPDKSGVDIYPDKIIALQDGGYLISGGQKRSENKVHVFRLLENGQLNKAFGDEGIATVSVEDKDATGDIQLVASTWMAVSEQSGKIYLSATYAYSEGIKGVVFRLNENGSPDTSFNGGFVLIGVQDAQIGLGSLAVHRDGVLVGGTIFATGYFEGDAFVSRYDDSGKEDTSFGDRGRVIIPNGTDDRRSFLTSIAVGANNMIVVTGRSGISGVREGLITVLNASGSFNLVFNNGAPLYSGFLAQLHFYECAIQQSGKIIVMGTGDTRNLIVARYNLDGSLDRTFAGIGWTVYREMGDFIYKDSSLTADNKIVILANQSLKPFAVCYLG